MIIYFLVLCFRGFFVPFFKYHSITFYVLCDRILLIFIIPDFINKISENIIYISRLYMCF